MPVNPDGPSKPPASTPKAPTPKQPTVDPTKPVVTQTKTLGEVPGLYDLLKQQGQQQTLTSTPIISHPMDAVSADELGLGADSFDDSQADDSDSGVLGSLTFDGAGPDSLNDPMADLHIPTLKHLGMKVNDDGTVALPSGGTGATGTRAQVIAAARKMLGTPYVWGGESANGVDCSGLIQMIFKDVGINLPRISADQARHGKRISLGKLRPGDLVAWDNSSRNNGADHIALYIGNGLIIEAPRPGRNVQISHLYDTGEAWGVAMNY